LAEPIRVLVAEDSLTVRRRIIGVLSGEPGMTVVGEAADGKHAIELCLALRPDVITLDMMMPVVSGLGATEYIMAFVPTPIVIVSGSTNRGEVFRTYDALAAGALDVIEKPRAGESLEAWDRRLIDTVRVASRVRVITHPLGRLRPKLAFDLQPGPSVGGEAAGARVVAIGASTGGPKAIVDVLQTLPKGFPAPVLIVTHISDAFAAGFIEWLASNSPLPVRAARHDETIPDTGVLVAPADRHLVVHGDRVQLTTTAARHSCRPSVDVLFESVARTCGRNGIGVLLTGMGRDGADGLLAMRQAGGVTVAQDEASSVIFGMPGEAVKIGAAEHVLPPAEIGALLRRVTAGAARPPATRR
jgi:two-component system chemotaxis response regulator CheB